MSNHGVGYGSYTSRKLAPRVAAKYLIYFLSLLFIFTLRPHHSRAQEPPAAQPLDLSAALEFALKNNPGLAASRQDVQYRQKLKKGSIYPEKTGVSLTYGQLNSVYWDNNITLSQSLSLPGLYRNQRSVAEAMTESAKQRQAITETELRSEVKSAWQQLAYARAQAGILRFYDSIYRRFEQAAELRYKTGETAYLELANARTASLEVRTRLQGAESDILLAESRLRTLLYAPSGIRFANAMLEKLSLPPMGDSVNEAINPYLAFYRQEISLREKETGLERARLLPDVMFGYFNQSIIGYQKLNSEEIYYSGRTRFSGIQAGVALPVWFMPQKARVNAAKINEQVAHFVYLQQKSAMQGRLAELIQEYRKFANAVEVYEKSGLREADLIIANSGKSYRAGEIGYMEYVLSIDRAVNLRTAWLQNLHALNQTVIQIEAIVGK